MFTGMKRLVLVCMIAAILGFGFGHCVGGNTWVNAAEATEIGEDKIALIETAWESIYDDFLERAEFRDIQPGVTPAFVGIPEGNVLYTIEAVASVRGLASLFFTKQVSLSDDVVDIYYEGIKYGEYKCYAKRLTRSDNCRMDKIPEVSIFELVVEKFIASGQSTESIFDKEEWVAVEDPERELLVINSTFDHIDRFLDIAKCTAVGAGLAQCYYEVIEENVTYNLSIVTQGEELIWITYSILEVLSPDVMSIYVEGVEDGHYFIQAMYVNDKELKMEEIDPQLVVENVLYKLFGRKV